MQCVRLIVCVYICVHSTHAVRHLVMWRVFSRVRVCIYVHVYYSSNDGKPLVDGSWGRVEGQESAERSVGRCHGF
jgi:hypothetical protein